MVMKIPAQLKEIAEQVGGGNERTETVRTLRSGLALSAAVIGKSERFKEPSTSSSSLPNHTSRCSDRCHRHFSH